MQKLVVHLISDSSGQTVKYAAKTALAQFADIEVKQYNWLLVRNKNLLDEVLNKIKKRPGVVLYTISNLELRELLKKHCRDLKLPCISVIGKIIKEISAYLGVGADENLSLAGKFDESYFDKVNAIDYTLRHDDGQMVNELEEADIVLIGPSRTSKTPTSVYLAYNGFKTANVPYVYGCAFPEYVEKLSNPLVVGLVINPSRLIAIREVRMNLLQMPEENSYTDVKIVQEECAKVKGICQQHNWSVIDVSSRSIEETAAVVMKLYYDKKKSALYK